MPADLTLVRRPDQSVFEARIADGKVAGSLTFHLTEEGHWRIEHTVVQPRFEGQGVGGFLARGALQAAREAQVQVLPDCSFIASYLARHPEDAELVPQVLRRKYGL